GVIRILVEVDPMSTDDVTKREHIDIESIFCHYTQAGVFNSSLPFQLLSPHSTTRLHRRNSVIISRAVNRSIFTADVSPAIERICFILSEEEEPKVPPLFTELDELLFVVLTIDLYFLYICNMKVARNGANPTSPHCLCQSLFELRTCIEKGTLFFDLEASNFKEIIEKIIDRQIANGVVTSQLKEKVMYVLLRNHRHHTKMSRIRVLAELGKKISCASFPLHKSTSLNRNNSDGLNEISEKPLNEQLKNKFKKKIPEGAEVTNALVGEVDFLNKPLVAFVRLQQAVSLGSLNEVPVPTRFLFILLGPKAKGMAYHQIGRAVATLLTDELFHIAAFKAKSREDLIAGIDEFLDKVTVLPPGKWDLTVRITPPKVLKLDLRKSVYSCKARAHTQKSSRKEVWFASEFYDALNIQCRSAVLFIYLATITNAITFGGMLGDATGNVQGVLESFLGTAVAGAVFYFFADQPLTILSSTGPVLVFERLLFNFTRYHFTHGLVYLEFRLWIGIWTGFFCLVLVATDASYLVQYFTRFTEEGFCTLLSFIFIHDALRKMFSLAENYPIWSHFDSLSLLVPAPSKCMLEPGYSSIGGSLSWSNKSANWSTHMKKDCLELGGQLVGRSCHFIPDVTLMSFILFFGTFLCVLLLKNFKTSRYFPTTVRKLISDFSTVLSILIFCGVDILVGVDTPKLIVPSEFKPTDPERAWFVRPFGGNAWWLCLVAAVPSVLVTILLFMDQQITAVLLNRKEHRLKKGAGFHLDLLCIAVLMILTSFMALPWYVSATVISLAHMDSLRMESTKSAPGEKATFVGVRCIGYVFHCWLMIGIGSFSLQYISMPVLYGIFLYMGVAALSRVQHQPDLLYLRHVSLRRIHLFTLFQVVCLMLLWGLKSTAAAIIFPIMLLALVGVRRGMECIFSRHDLSWLDDLLPEREQEEEKRDVQQQERPCKWLFFIKEHKNRHRPFSPSSLFRHSIAIIQLLLLFMADLYLNSISPPLLHIS
uniref:Anion exchange protein n=1 Tax=Callorhinchus milii TaxID=7868 RepID=A0A4W3HDB4_CALMI